MATIKELRAQIKQETMNVNQRLVEYLDTGKRYKIVDKEIEWLKQTTGTASNKAFLSMNTHRKNKAELELQLSSLKQFQQWDIYTPYAKRENQTAARRAYQTYKRNTGSRIKFKTYNKAVTILGALSSKIGGLLSQISEDVKEQIETVMAKKRSPKQIISAWEQVMAENKNQGKSPEDYLDDVQAKLRLD